MLHSFYLKYNNIELKPLKAEEIENLRIWRNDKSQTKYLRQIGYITPEMQKEWFKNYEKDNNIISFSIYETDILNRMVGSVSLYDFDKINKIVEIGKIQIGDNDARGQGIGRISFVMLLKLAFEMFGVKKVIATVNINNIPARKSYFKIGFKIVGQHKLDDTFEDDIEIDKDMVVKNNPFYDKIQIIQKEEKK